MKKFVLSDPIGSILGDHISNSIFRKDKFMNNETIKRSVSHSGGPISGPQLPDAKPMTPDPYEQKPKQDVPKQDKK